MAMFLLTEKFSPELVRRNFYYYDPLTTGDSSLSACVQAIVAAQIGEHELAMQYFRTALFMDLADLHGNTTDGVHLASAGGVWMAIVYGFAGMTDVGGEIGFDPRLPAEWDSVFKQEGTTARGPDHSRLPSARTRRWTSRCGGCHGHPEGGDPLT